MTLHLVYMEVTFMSVLSVSFQVCQVKKDAQISPLLSYDPGHMQYRWTKHVGVDNTHAEPTQPTQHLAMFTKHDNATHHKQKSCSSRPELLSIISLEIRELRLLRWLLTSVKHSYATFPISCRSAP